MKKWFPILRADRDRITGRCGASSASVLAVWCALNDLADQASSQTFDAFINNIAHLAGVSRPTTKRALKTLREIQMVQWKQNAAAAAADGQQLAASTFTLHRSIPNEPRAGSQRPGVGSPRSPLPEPVIKYGEYKEGKEGRPLTTAERIGLENQLKILRIRWADLETETAEQWQRDAHPELVAEKQELRAKITKLENILLAV